MLLQGKDPLTYLAKFIICADVKTIVKQYVNLEFNLRLLQNLDT
jgi:hypothetical protein